ncbi:MAG: hypothetical protein ABI378_00560 [Chitinophagaceae bacterium]
MPKPKILVLYYSQTGQLRDILNNVLKNISQDAELTFAAIEPEKPYLIPWKVNGFFDLMPECAFQEPIPLKPLDRNILAQDFDLVIFGWQPWFLHPSLPISSFLQSDDAEVLKNMNVVTIVGSRNMWLNAAEKIKEHFQRIGANQIGNIVFEDSNTNLVSLLTIIRWSFKGKKEASGMLPEAGVQKAAILAASRFGKPILEAAKNKDLAKNLHQELMKLNAVNLNSGLILLEQRGIKNFRFWAGYIKRKGPSGSPERLSRVIQFKRLLIVGVFILSPISSFTAFIQKNLQRKKLEKDVEYFKGIDYEADRI